MANPSVTVDFLADTSGLSKGIDQANSSAGSFGKSLKTVGKMGALAAGAAGVGALVYTLKTGIGEFQESTKVAAQTEAVLKSTGGTAGITAEQVGSLAESLMKKSGVDDEAIASGENLLLTFTNIRNEAGKGNDIFNQTTAAALDMSVALGTDVTSAAMQLGKALNDPVKGMTRLTKSGVTFTEAQKEQVKAMVEAGDTMGAQKLILRELNKEFGGSAEAMGNTLPGQISILKESFNNFAGMLVGKVVPYVEQAIASLRDHWPEIQAALQTAWTTIQPALAALGDVLKAVGTVVMEVVALIRDNWGTIGPIVKANVDILVLTFQLLADVLKVIAALLRGDWSAAWQAAKDAVATAADLIRARVEAALLPLQAILGGLWNGIKAAADAAWNAIKSLIATIVNAIKTDVTQTWNDIKTAVTTIVNALKTAMETAWNAIKTVVTTAASAVEAAVDAVKAAFNAAKAAGAVLAGFFEGAWNTAANAAKAVASAVSGAIDAIRAAFNSAKSAASTLVGYLSGPLTSAFNAAKGVVDALAGPFNSIAGAASAAADAVQGLISAIKAIPSKISLPSIPGVGALGKAVGLESGGVVSRPTFAMIGEGRGREIVSPERLMRQIMREEGGGGRAQQVRVFIGDTELKTLVRTQVVDVNAGVARTLLAGTP